MGARLLVPPSSQAMTRVRNFVADLARASKSYKEIKNTSNIVYGDKSLKKTVNFAIIKNA